MWYSQQLLTSYLIKHLSQWSKCRILSYWPWLWFTLYFLMSIRSGKKKLGLEFSLNFPFTSLIPLSSLWTGQSYFPFWVLWQIEEWKISWSFWKCSHKIEQRNKILVDELEGEWNRSKILWFIWSGEDRHLHKKWQLNSEIYSRFHWK